MIEKVANMNSFKKILGANKYVVTQFTASWCGPCQMIKPYLENYAKDYSNVHFVKVDVDEADELVDEYRPQSVPLFISFKDQKQVGNMVGANPEQLKKFIDDLLKN